MDPSFIHSYEAGKKILQDLAEISPQWLANKQSITFLISIDTFGNPFGLEISLD
jgi:lysylphosphatidylglycerol synthetase-like protein (DUF2156 family)